MSPGLRKLALTTHVVCSVGWLGAVASFLALAIVGLTTTELARACAVYLAADLIAWTVILPLCLASLLTGLLQALGTPWGLFRHYWVLFKFVLTVLSTLLLLLHMTPIGRMADTAAAATVLTTDFDRLRIQLVADAAAALLVLLVITTLSVFKPRGLTRYGRRLARKATGQAAAVP